MRTAEAIRDHFRVRLNSALRLSGMYGGEGTLRGYLRDLAFVEEREAELEILDDDLRERNAFISTGVTGAFRVRTNGHFSTEDVASVYAEIAFQMGYLDADRVLDRSEFAALRKGLRQACRDSDFTPSQARARFGAPSWSAGTNPYYPCVFLYLTEEPSFGAIAFDFWNAILCDHDKPDGEKVHGEFGDQPVLRNVRIRTSDFARDFTFTPKGRSIIQSPATNR